jgi:hypothetical protein
MSDLKALLESADRAVSDVPLPPGGLDQLERLRVRKRRNQRIAAGVVGIAVFLAAVSIVIDAEWVDRTKTPAAGPRVTGPTGDPFAVDGFEGLPPKGVAPSEPLRGELVMSKMGIHPWWHIYMYADGRVVWLEENGFQDPGLAVASGTPPTTGWLERRLTPEGIELLRSRPDLLSRWWVVLPASAWEDPEAKPYVPARYLVCTSQETIPLLPQRAQDLLRGYTDERAVVTGEDHYSAGGQGFTCPTVTIEEARTLDGILREVGYGRREDAGALAYDIGSPDSYFSSIGVIPLLPDGKHAECCPG